MSDSEIPPYMKTALPQLPIDLREKKLSIALTWIAIILPTCILPNALYFGIRYGANDLDTALTVPTAILGGCTVLSWVVRCWQLFRKKSDCRPLGSGRWMGDYFHWNILLATILVTSVLATATSDDPPNIRQASMPQSIVLFWAGTQVIITGIMEHMGLKMPIRLSSRAAGSPARPGVFTLTEDVVAVDGGGGEAFRLALESRYEASPVFRQLLRKLNWFWGIGSILAATGTTLIVFLVNDLNVVFALGWSLPFVWGAVAVVTTIFWAKRALHREEVEWRGGEI